jgi:hypothetical protein
MGRWRRWQWRPSYYYRVVLHEADVRLFLKYRGMDWKVEAGGINLETWFKQHGKGLMRFTCHPTRDNLIGAKIPVEIGFTDSKVAVLCKLQMGGR